MAFFSRGKNKIQNPYTIQDSYKKYVEDCDNKLYEVDYSLYKDILCDYLKASINYIFDSSMPFKLMHNLGRIQIIKKKTYASSQVGHMTTMDWENSVKYNKQIYHLNEHSNGYKYLFFWNKKSCKNKNISKYRFVPTRENKRRLAHYIKNKVRDYLERIK